MINIVVVAAAGLLSLPLSLVQAAPKTPAAPTVDKKALAAALDKYLQSNGELCVGKFDWPIDVAPGDAEAGSRDAVQLPVLQQLGLAEAASGMVLRKDADGVEHEVPVQRFSLTPAGRKFYVRRETTTLSPKGEKVLRQGDFCPAKVRLDKLVSWEAPLTLDGGIETTASFTYKIAAANWMREPAARRVFPMVDHIIQGEGQMQMKQRLRFAKGRWLTVLPGE